jgi:anti-sigma factor ChrR (cupin superfamily)
MTTASSTNRCDQSERLAVHAIDGLPASEAGAMEAHLAVCAECRRELAALRPVVDAFASWPVDVLRPGSDLRRRLAEKIAADEGGEPVMPALPEWTEPEWEEVAPGISCKLLATDTTNHLVSMLVRLAPNTAYPPHDHAAVEELHLLEGELWIEDRKLLPGDYNRAEPGTGDQRVFSETGCTCVLITSARDVLR